MNHASEFLDDVQKEAQLKFIRRSEPSRLKSMFGSVLSRLKNVSYPLKSLLPN